MDNLSTTLKTLGGLFLLGCVTDGLGRLTRLPRVTLLLLFGVVIGPGVLDLLPRTDGACPGRRDPGPSTLTVRHAPSHPQRHYAGHEQSPEPEPYPSSRHTLLLHGSASLSCGRTSIPPTLGRRAGCVSPASHGTPTVGSSCSPSGLWLAAFDPDPGLDASGHR